MYISVQEQGKFIIRLVLVALPLQLKVSIFQVSGSHPTEMLQRVAVTTIQTTTRLI